jgi:hypothetical protein
VGGFKAFLRLVCGYLLGQFKVSFEYGFETNLRLLKASC